MSRNPHSEKIISININLTSQVLHICLICMDFLSNYDLVILEETYSYCYNEYNPYNTYNFLTYAERHIILIDSLSFHSCLHPLLAVFALYWLLTKSDGRRNCWMVEMYACIFLVLSYFLKLQIAYLHHTILIETVGAVNSVIHWKYCLRRSYQIRPSQGRTL